jgi:cbb3-type cytochrome oxidase maturation protein
MSAIILLLLVSIGIAAGFLLAFFWSVRDGQFDDDYSPARRILFEDDKKVKSDASATLSNRTIQVKSEE